MNKRGFVDAVAERANLKKKDAEASVTAAMDVVKELLEKGDLLNLIGFGNFSVGERSERTSRNPQTGEKIKIPACRVPKFKFSKTVRDAVK